MKFLGSVSGRDEDKIKEAGVHVGYHNGVPYIDEGSMIMICRVQKLQYGRINFLIMLLISYGMHLAITMICMLQRLQMYWHGRLIIC